MSEAPRDERAARAEPWTVRRVLGWTTQRFDALGLDAPRLTAELLLAHVLGATRVRLYTDLDRPLAKEELARYRGLIERRTAREPTQYLTGVQDFYGRTFRVDARVLVPRPETELLVEAALRALPSDRDVRVLDLCTGSGCVGVTIASERPNGTVVATDVSADAAEVARANAEALGVAARIEVRVGDLFAALPEGCAGFDVVVSNPPYVARGELPGLQPEVRREPVLALDGGPDGLDLVRRIVAGARERLVDGGVLALEIGDGQGAAVRTLLEGAGYGSVTVERDLARHDRVAFGTRPHPDRGQPAAPEE